MILDAVVVGAGNIFRGVSGASQGIDRARLLLPGSTAGSQKGIFVIAPFLNARRAAPSQPPPSVSSATFTTSDLPSICRPYRCLESPATQLGHVVRMESQQLAF